MSFSAFSDDVPVFLDELGANNTREWFAANKARYEQGIKAPAEAFGTAVCAELAAQTGLHHKSKLFRIYRDVRFSKDKTPYNAHLHLSFTPETGQAAPPMWFFGLGAQRLSLGCGVFAFDKPQLAAFRERVAGADGTGLREILAELESRGVRFSEPDLKRIPPGFDKDHPNGDLLRRKGLSAWIDFEDRLIVAQPGLIDFTMQAFNRLRPVFDFLITA